MSDLEIRPTDDNGGTVDRSARPNLQGGLRGIGAQILGNGGLTMGGLLIACALLTGVADAEV
ncbi:MAG TPA: hypothetical protein QGH10_22190, partial [Armatimonadota bacterium]|nr:hypothetical protein [Armatimonadota bacterium]